MRIRIWIVFRVWAHGFAQQEVKAKALWRTASHSRKGRAYLVVLAAGEGGKVGGRPQRPAQSSVGGGLRAAAHAWGVGVCHRRRPTATTPESWRTWPRWSCSWTWDDTETPEHVTVRRRRRGLSRHRMGRSGPGTLRAWSSNGRQQPKQLVNPKP